MKQSTNWGYKGSETALNGLTNWLQSNTGLDSAKQQYQRVIEFAIHKELFKPKRPIDWDKRHPNELLPVAHRLARQVQEKQLFEQFTAWVIKNHSS